MIVADHYTYRVRWSAEDESFVATVADFPSLSWLDEDQIEAFKGIHRLVGETVEEMAANGESVPEAISDRSYSGQFMVRVPPEMHRRLVVEAAEQRVSLNRLASSRLAGSSSP